MEFLKKNFKLIIILIITILITVSITVYATTTYLASSIEYTRTGKNVNNVGAALDDLYNTTSGIAQTNATASDILNGKKAYTTNGLVTGNLVNPTSYSTTEQVVGTWIDGRPVYQRTIDWGAGPNNAQATKTLTSLGLGDLDMLIAGYGFGGVTVDGVVKGYGLLPNPERTSSVNGGKCSVFVFVWDGALYLESNFNTSNYHWYVTIQYTKTES